MDEKDLRILKLEKEVREMREIFDNIFGGSNQTRLYLKRKVAFDREALIGFFGVEPVKKQSAITAPTGGGTVDSQARTAIGTIITTLQTLGLIS
jgi:hypothetical protein